MDRFNPGFSPVSCRCSSRTYFRRWLPAVSHMDWRAFECHGYDADQYLQDLLAGASIPGSFGGDWHRLLVNCCHFHHPAVLHYQEGLCVWHRLGGQQYWLVNLCVNAIHVERDC